MLFDNNWFNWFLSNFSIAIASVPIISGFLLKLLAIFNPNVPSDKIIDLVNHYWKVKQ